MNMDIMKELAHIASAIFHPISLRITIRVFIQVANMLITITDVRICVLLVKISLERLRTSIGAKSLLMIAITKASVSSFYKCNKFSTMADILFCNHIKPPY